MPGITPANLATWYGVGAGLELKPLWQVNNEGLARQFHPCRYDPVQQLFVGIEYAVDEIGNDPLTDVTFVVIDAKTGTSIARLNLGDLSLQSIANPFWLSSFHFIGDYLCRFEVRVENGQEIVELRSWAFRTEQMERVEHIWHVHLNAWYPMWDQEHPELFFIYQPLPSISRGSVQLV